MKPDSTQIVIADRGFIWVGKVTLKPDMVLIRDAKQVRRWGTTQGLGEIAKGGPTRSTILDPAGTVQLPLRAVIAFVECKESAWAAQ